MVTITAPLVTDPGFLAHAQLLNESYRYWLGQPLLTSQHSPQSLATRLYQAPFVLVSHGTEADPLFNYANLTAQKLWELDWTQFVGMPSRHSAEAVEQHQRARALSGASQTGFIADYSGIRISASGRRFYILNAVVWNLLDAQGNPRGQAATFSRWEYLPSSEDVIAFSPAQKAQPP
jgi:hypothetical protein